MNTQLVVPTLIEKSANGVSGSDVFSKLFNDRNVFLCGVVSTESVTAMIAQLLALDSQSHDPIYLYLNSVGGSVDDGLALCDVMNVIQSPVYTVGMGIVASMGAVILANGEKGNRWLLPNALVMIHEVRTQNLSGTLSDLKISLEVMERQGTITSQILANATGKPLDQIKRDIQKDFYMSAQEALDYGLVDHIESPAKA